MVDWKERNTGNARYTNRNAAMSMPHPETTAVRSLDRRLAPAMFALAFAYLALLAGLIHRAASSSVKDAELYILYEGLVALWPAFAVEAGFAFVRRCPEVSRGKAAARVLLVLACPPARMGWIHPATNRIWLPRVGWVPPGKPLLKALDKWFGVPMLLFAFLILPVLGLEYANIEAAKTTPGFALAADIGVAIIWIAFATEFIVKASASPNTLDYAKQRWLDAAIVLLPTLEFLLTRWVDAAPLARLLRLGRAVAPDQIAKMGKVYRLRGLMMKGWHAFLLLEGVARLTGNSPAKRLAAVEKQIADLEEQLVELRTEADELRKRIEDAENAKRETRTC